MCSTTVSETLKTILSLITKVRDEYNRENGLGMILADHCDAVSQKLLDEMESHGITGGYLVSGEYEHAYPDSPTDLYGHVWIEWDDYIIDATRCQFDSSEFIVLAESTHNYIA